MADETISFQEVARVVNSIGEGFDAFKKVNEQRLEEERKENEGRAKELAASLDKISAQLSDDSKKKAELDKKYALMQERIELIEAMNDRPKATLKDRIETEHKEIFLDWIRGRGNDSHAEQRYRDLQAKAREVKDVSLTNAAGGFAVPKIISDVIGRMVLAQSEIVANVRNVQATTSDYQELVSVNVATYTWAAEADSRAATVTPVLRNRKPTSGELYAYATTSNFALQDMAFSVEAWIAEAVAEGFSVGLSSALWNGNGSSKPTGLINGAPVSTADWASPLRSQEVIQYKAITAHGSPFAASGFNGDDLINLAYSLNPRYRTNARFAANTATQGYIRRLKTTNGDYVWQPSLQLGQPDRVIGFPMFTWEDCGTATTGNALPVIFGDFNQGYLMVTRPDMGIVRDQVTAPGFTKFYIAQRFGGIIKNNDALKALKIALS